MNVEDYHFHVKWSSEDNVFIGSVDEYPSLHAHADTTDHALDRIKLVTAMVMVDLLMSDEPLPLPNPNP